MIDDLVKSYFSYESNNRQIGRYWATDINSIKSNRLRSDNFFDKPKFNLYWSKMMLTGIAMENMLTKIIKKSNVKCVFQEKKNIQINDEINLVVMPDFIFDDMVLETKFPFYLKNYDMIPKRYEFQLECEYRAFNKSIVLGLFSNPFDIKFLNYEPSIDRWNEIKNLLINFHNQLKNSLKSCYCR